MALIPAIILSLALFLSLLLSTHAAVDCSSLFTNTTAAGDKCNACAKYSECIYCNDDDTCMDGSFYGTWRKGSHCSMNYQWKQCSKLRGDIAMYLVAAGVGLIIIVVVAVIIYCSCKKCSRKKDEEYKLINNEPANTKFRHGNEPNYLPYAL